MSTVANLLQADGRVDIVQAKDCSEADRFKPYFCPECGCSMFLRMGDIKEKHFSGNHVDDCDIGTGHYKTSVTTTGYVLSIEALLKHKDKPVSLADEEVITRGDGHNNLKAKPKNEEDIFTVFVPSTRYLNNIKSIYRYIAKLPLDCVIDVDSGLSCRDFLVNGNTIFSCRRDGFEKEVRLVVASRISPSALVNAPKMQGYLLLRDAYSRDNNEAIYFLVKIDEPSQYEKFRRLLFGTKENPALKSPSKHILLLANWRRMSGTKYHVYYADINAKSYAFID